jgi:hypothetical protein
MRYADGRELSLQGSLAEVRHRWCQLYMEILHGVGLVWTFRGAAMVCSQ